MPFTPRQGISGCRSVTCVGKCDAASPMTASWRTTASSTSGSSGEQPEGLTPDLVIADGLDRVQDVLETPIGASRAHSGMASAEARCRASSSSSSATVTSTGRPSASSRSALRLASLT